MRQSYRTGIVAVCVVYLVILSGCVMQDEFRRTTGILDERIDTLEKRVEQCETDLKDIRKRQADNSADVAELRRTVQRLNGAVEELAVDIGKREQRIRAEIPKEAPRPDDAKTDALSARIDYIERYLDIGKEAAPSPSPRPPRKEQPAEKDTAKAPSMEKAYADAYALFKDGKYAKARQQFHAFRESFPRNEYSDNAQYWIGETFYFEKSYEKAILEYQKVIQDYPKGNKVPNALLKQALSFIKLDDTASAKLLLQRVIKDYPGTTPAKIARSRLKEVQ